MRSNPILATTRLADWRALALQPDAGHSGSTRKIVEVRPNGLANGKYGWPAWGIGVVGGILLVAGLLVWGLRLYQYKKRG
ncbi:MAG: hypothetical protein AB7K71_25095 [Polyangiaceae bacterium]